jgi:hypothetical protein
MRARPPLGRATVWVPKSKEMDDEEDRHYEEGHAALSREPSCPGDEWDWVPMGSSDWEQRQKELDLFHGFTRFFSSCCLFWPPAPSCKLTSFLIFPQFASRSYADILCLHVDILFVKTYGSVTNSRLWVVVSLQFVTSL